jgi:hypothetical protein
VLVYVVDDFLYVAICGLFALYILDLPPSSVCEVCDEVSLCACSVADGSDEVWSVVFWFMLWL